MIGSKKWVKVKKKTATDEGYREYMCYNFTNQYYKFVCIDRRCLQFIKIPIIANISSDYIHGNLWIDDNEYDRASP